MSNDIAAKTKESPPKIALTIAGSDSSGGAGIQADLKTFSTFGCFGMSVLTAITAQNSQAVTQVEVIKPDLLRAQLEALFNDYTIDVVKIGMIGSAVNGRVIAEALTPHRGLPIVLDTPLKASTGDDLGEEGIAQALVDDLFPMATLITPNLEEAAIFLGEEKAQTIEEMITQAQNLHKLGANAVLLKGGHLPEHNKNEAGVEVGIEAVDVMVEGQAYALIKAPWVDTPNNHGTGCILAAAIAANLAIGHDCETAIHRAKQWLTECLKKSAFMQLGTGRGPVNITKMPQL